MTQTVVNTVLGAALALNGTITIGYPTGKSRGDFLNGRRHYVVINQDQYSEPNGASFAFNAADIVITYRGATTQPQGASVIVNLDEPGGAWNEQPDIVPLPNNVTPAGVVVIDLGSPDAAVANGIAVSQSIGAGAYALLNGAMVVNGVAEFDVPRCVVGAWTTNSVVTILARDENGVLFTESSASGVAFTGKKAAKQILRIHSTVAITAATFGSGDVLGLPSWFPGAGHILKEIQDGAAAAAGTLVAGLATGTKSTAVTGDVRGTYDPSAACNGSIAFKIAALLEDPAFKGNPQFLDTAFLP